MGSDTGFCGIRFCVGVSIHAPTWGATYRFTHLVNIQSVSIHAPTWGATGWDWHTKHEQLFQSTLPHGERRMAGSTARAFAVSIHAPTWGATTLTILITSLMMFQSTLPHGERQAPCSRFRSHHSFNPRSHMGSDSVTMLKAGEELVSIHAPTWGATCSADSSSMVR